LDQLTAEAARRPPISLFLRTYSSVNKGLGAIARELPAASDNRSEHQEQLLSMLHALGSLEKTRAAAADRVEPRHRS
jgi:hypothetical protein